MEPQNLGTGPLPQLFFPSSTSPFAPLPPAPQAKATQGPASTPQASPGTDRDQLVGTTAVPAGNAYAGYKPLSVLTGSDDAAKTAAVDQILAGSSQQTRDFINHVAKANFDKDGMNAVYQLAAEGKLDGINPDGSNLRDLITQNLATADSSGVRIAQAVVTQLANPDGEIWQGQPNTCVAATAQKALAESNPAAYFKLATDIIRTGSTNLPNGQQVALSSQNRDWIDKQNLTPEDKMDAMLQASLMDFGNHGTAHFDMSQDVSVKNDGSTYKGLGLPQAERLDQALLSAPTLDVAKFHQAVAAAQGANGGNLEELPAAVGVLNQQLQNAKSSGGPGVFVPMKTGQDDGAHMVLLQSIDGNSATVLDATGKPRSVPLVELYSKLDIAGGDEGGIGTTGGTYTQGSGGTRHR
jgi:hypothetical protein